MKNNHILKTGLLFLLWCVSSYLHAQVIAETNPGTAQGSTGTIKFTYGGNEVTYTTVRAKDGNVWLQQNIGSTRVATSQTDANSWGDLFQWGRWDDGHHLRSGATTSNTTPTPNNPMGLNASTTDFYYHATASSRWWGGGVNTDKTEAASSSAVSATNGCDPCKKLLGGEWRLPTQTEWNALITAESITYNVDAYNSNLKIPSTTFRDGSNGNLNANTNTTRLWSSTAGVSGGAYVFNVTNSANSASTTNISRAQGFGVRCINVPITTTPVGFINFKGKSNASGINLEWIVASETNNDFYTIKHSLDGITFTDLNTFKGKGNTSTQQIYSHLHKKPSLGKNYYKLLQTDFDGTQRELSTIVVTSTSLENGKIVITATDNTVKVIPMGYDKKIKKITILTVSGGIVYAAKIKNDNMILPITLNKGTYIAQIAFDDSTTKAVKFLK